MRLWADDAEGDVDEANLVPPAVHEDVEHVPFTAFRYVDDVEEANLVPPAVYI